MISNYQMNNVMDFLFGKKNYVVPDNLYLGLSKTAINADGTGATEPSGNGYTRAVIANNKTSFENAINGVIKNLIQVTFDESTGDWGTISHVFLSDALTGGNILYYDELEKARVVQDSTVLTFPIGGLTFTLHNQTQ